MARLKKVTTAVGINVLFTFLFNMIPDLLILLCKFENQTPLFILLNGNAMVNMIMFTYRFKEIRQGLKSLVHCRSLIVSSNVGPTAAISNQKPMVTVSQKSLEYAGNRSLK
uniref:Uncharacterized protein n=1 Tax=Plectus sambesii TaxID=2011161 RepID=A0A914XL18_9BILA